MQDRDLTKVEKVLPSYSAEDTAEEVELLRLRLRLFFGIGLIASLITLIADLMGFKRFEDVAFSSLAPYYNFILWSFPAVGLVGLLLLMREWSSHGLHLIDELILTLYIFLITFSSSVFSPSTPRVFGYAILLFAHAAFVPSRVWLQVAIGATVSLSYPLGLVLAYHYLPEVHEIWSRNGGPVAFRSFVITRLLDMFLLAAISVMVTKTLYHFRTRLSHAQRLGNYILKGELGKGGMGTVYEASHAFLARPTAIKVLTPRHENIKDALLRFEKEVKLCCQLTHPNTITIFDYGAGANHTFYYAMELLQGVDLKRLVEVYGPLPLGRCVHLLRQICGSLGEAHGMGIVHRDIKPSNVFLTQRGGICDFVKVLDFGLAREYRKEKTAAAAGVFEGTPRYTAPECVKGGMPIDGRADIYMVGNLAYFLLTGQAPFELGSDMELMHEHLELQAEPPSHLDPSIPKQMDDIVLRCLRKDPAERFQCVEDLDRALGELEAEQAWSSEAAKAWWREKLNL